MDLTLAQGLLLVGAGGAIGAVLRFSVGLAIDTEEFPWATFTVNIIGSFLLATIAFGWTGIPQYARLFIFTGLFGAFTTMSTFSLDTVALLFDDKVPLALANFGMNAGLCIVGAMAGRYAGLMIAC